MDDQTRRARLAHAADILQALLDEYHDEYDAWEREELTRAIAALRAAHADEPETQPPVPSGDGAGREANRAAPACRVRHAVRAAR